MRERISYFVAAIVVYFICGLFISYFAFERIDWAYIVIWTILMSVLDYLIIRNIKKWISQKNKNIMDIKNAQLAVDNWIKEHGVRYFNELTNMAQLTEEVGEVARIIARRYGEQSEKESDKNKDLGEELADVVFVVLCLANQTGVNLQEAFDKKMDLKTNRDHDRHHNNEKLK